MVRTILLTTVLVASGAVAHAEVTLSGDARMGVIKNFPPFGAADNEPLQFTSRARVKVDMTGTTDGGLKFGATFRINDAGDASTGAAGEVSLSGDFGSITMGDVDSAALSAVDHVSGVGLTDLGSLNEIRYIANGFSDTDPSVLYRITRGDWEFYASVVNPGTVSETIIDTVDPALSATVTSDSGVQAYAVAARYEQGNYAVALGYETLNVVYGPGRVVDQQNLMLGLEASFDALRLQAIIGRFQGTDVDFNYTSTDPIPVSSVQLNNLSGTQYAISADYSVNDTTTLTAFYTDDSEYDGTQAYGLGASYDLGGGATVKGGYVTDQADGAASYDIGVQMSF